MLLQLQKEASLFLLVHYHCGRQGYWWGVTEALMLWEVEGMSVVGNITKA